MIRNTFVIAAVLIFALGLVIYANALYGGFIWDDLSLVVNNAYIQSWRNIPKILSEDMGAGSGAPYGYYRPLQFIIYIVIHYFCGLDVFAYHLANILAHILVCLAVFWLVRMLFANHKLALLAAALFLAHPVQTEVVSYISALSELLCALFILLCLIFYIKQEAAGNMKFFILSLASYALALLAKENSLITPFLVLLYGYSFGKKINMKCFAGLCVISAIYLFLRLSVLCSLFSNPANSSSCLLRIPGFFAALVAYLRILIFPAGLHMEYGQKLFSLANPQAIFGLGLAGAAAALMIKGRRKDKLAVFACGWFFICLLPYSNIFPALASYMSEHSLYLASFGFFLLSADFLLAFYERKETRLVSGIAVAALFLLYGLLTIRQNRYWQNEITFYRRSLQFTEGSPGIYNNLCRAYNVAGRYKEAVSACEKSIRLKPDLAYAWVNLGNSYAYMGDDSAALRAYSKAIGFSPRYEYAYNQLGLLYLNQGRLREACGEFQRALEINPRYQEANKNFKSLNCPR